MEVVVGVEFALWSRIGKVYRFFRIHGNKNLYQRKKPRKHALRSIFFNLMRSLTDRNAALF